MSDCNYLNIKGFSITHKDDFLCDLLWSFINDGEEEAKARSKESDCQNLFDKFSKMMKEINLLKCNKDFVCIFSCELKCSHPIAFGWSFSRKTYIHKIQPKDKEKLKNILEKYGFKCEDIKDNQFETYG